MRMNHKMMTTTTMMTKNLSSSSSSSSYVPRPPPTQMKCLPMHPEDQPKKPPDNPAA